MIKVEEGLMTGDVMFHEFIKKTNKKGVKNNLADDENLEDFKTEEETDRKLKKQKNKNSQN